VQCLKYLVLASMLMESRVDPFNAQETQPYRNEPQIQAITGLVEAYQQGDIAKFERVLRCNRQTILEDPFIRPYMEDLMTVLRTQVFFACHVSRFRSEPACCMQTTKCWHKRLDASR
jgi:COP9 signalosome complex subunit 2